LEKPQAVTQLVVIAILMAGTPNQVVARPLSGKITVNVQATQTQESDAQSALRAEFDNTGRRFALLSSVDWPAQLFAARTGARMTSRMRGVGWVERKRDPPEAVGR
jgi:hypothetical protein